MENELKEELMRSIIRLKKIGMPFPPGNNMHLNELTIMRDIAEHSESSFLSASELQTRLFVSKPAISQMLSSLEKKGYINREVYTDDRRRNVIKITPFGLKTMNAMRERSDEVLTEIIKRFGEDNARTLIRLFNLFADVSNDVMTEMGEQNAAPHMEIEH